MDRNTEIIQTVHERPAPTILATTGLLVPGDASQADSADPVALARREARRLTAVRSHP